MSDSTSGPDQDAQRKVSSGANPNPNVPWSRKVFRGLLRTLPADFRANFGREMEGVFEEQARDAEHEARTDGFYEDCGGRRSREYSALLRGSTGTS